MSKVDDELTRRLHGAERLVDDDSLFEGLERRRSHRERMRRVQAGLLAFAVLAGTGIGFVALREAFGETERNVGQSPVLAGNGEIVFSREGADGRFHLYAVRSDGSGLRQITRDSTNDTDPAVSPGGETIAYVHELDREIPEESDTDPGTPRVRVIATVPIDGGVVSWHTPDDLFPSDPAWSPDGSQLAFVGSTVDSAALYVTDVSGGKPQRLPQPAELEQWPAHPSWSPDGTRIAFAALDFIRSYTSSDLGIVHQDGTGLEWLVESSDSKEEAPSWSPDGSRIAFLQSGDGGHEVWTIAPEGTSRTLVAEAVGPLEPDLAWAPDGSALLVSDGDWIYRMDPTPSGDLRDNLVQLVKGRNPSWQPLPTESAGPEPSASPSPSPVAEEGEDVGLAFDLCQAERLGGIDFLGDGTNGVAWIGVPTRDDGTCAAQPRADAYVAAADRDDDGTADAWTHLPWECNVLCVPYDATDLDGNGSEELIVASYFSIMDYYVLGLKPVGGTLELRPLLVAERGHEPADLIAGEPLRIDAGGDAGYGSQIECEAYPGAPVLIWSWSNSPVDNNGPREVHITRIQLQGDGRFHVIGTNDYTVPADQPSGIQRSTKPACGVDFHPDA